MDSAPRPEFSSLTRNEHVDVCIVGAGIAGLTTAYLLRKAGNSVIVLEDGMIGSGETQRTTVHLVTVSPHHDAIRHHRRRVAAMRDLRGHLHTPRAARPKG